MSRRLNRTLYGMCCLLISGVVVASGCKGSTGPPGLLPDGDVSGKIIVWEDAVFNSENSPTTVPAGGFTVSLVGDSTRSATTGPDGAYSITGAPAGTYIIETSRQANSPTGYGTMKRYNFVVGGGNAFHSESIGRKGPKPNSVSAFIDSVTGTSGIKISGMRVAWSITPASSRFKTFIYHVTFQSSTVGTFFADFVGSGALLDTTVVIVLPPAEYTVAVQGDIGFGYIDESNGQAVFPSRSAATLAPNTVTLTRPALIDLSPKSIAREFPNRRVVVARVDE